MRARLLLGILLVASGLALVLGWGKAAPKPSPPNISPPEKVVNFFAQILKDSEELVFPHIPIKISFLDTILALDTCAAYRKAQGKARHPWLQVFVSCIICCFGGTTMTAILLGQPPGWLGSLTSPMAYVIGFWGIFCCPGDIIYKIYMTFFPVRLVCGLINCLSGAHGVTSWGAEKALHAFHLGNVQPEYAAEHVLSGYAGSGPFVLLCGVVSGCGGGMLGAWIRCNGASPNWSLDGTPPVLRKPSVTVKLAFLSSLTYYCLRNPHHFLPWGMDIIPIDYAKLVILCLWVYVQIAGDMFDVKDPLGWMFPSFGVVLGFQREVGGEPELGFFEDLFASSPKQEQSKKVK